MRPLLLSALAVLAPAVAAPVCASTFPSGAEADPDDQTLRRTWKGLDPGERDDVAEWFRLEVSYLDTFQAKLIAFLSEAEEIDPGLLPAADPPGYFDPEVHAPGQPVPRRMLDRDDRHYRSLHERVFGREGTSLPRAWDYDWREGEIRRTGDPRDPELVFENALAGLVPRADLARAICLKILDDGSQHLALGAFGHVYTDRQGRAYPGVTLYDAWSSGETIEMPDVDVLGIVHHVLDEWKRWKAPVAASKQKKLYEKVGEIFQGVRRYRGLREAMADCLLRGTPPVGDYGPTLVNLHALWEDVSSDPHELRERLPGAEKWESFLKKWNRSSQRDKKLMERANARWRSLLGDEAQVRATLVRVLREYGALAR